MSSTRAVSRRTLAVLLAAVTASGGLALSACADNPGNAPGARTTAPAPPVVSSTSPGEPQAATLNWARSMCQALRPALDQLGTTPRADPNSRAATRQAYIAYLANARDATQRAIDQLSSLGAPPVQNGQQIIDQIRAQLVGLRDNLNSTWVQLNQADPNDASAIGQVVGAAGNVVGLFTTLATNSQLRAALDQAPECRNLGGSSGTDNTSPPPATSRPNG
ncbi:MAG TPA: hypothetical protein VGL88_12890 [Pseudonocardiaceae bacterium]|jgi:hypothetical protein